MQLARFSLWFTPGRRLRIRIGGREWDEARGTFQKGRGQSAGMSDRDSDRNQTETHTMSAVGFSAPHVFHLCHPIYEWAAFIFCAAHFRICFAVANSFQPRCIPHYPVTPFCCRPFWPAESFNFWRSVMVPGTNAWLFNMSFWLWKCIYLLIKKITFCDYDNSSKNNNNICRK